MIDEDLIRAVAYCRVGGHRPNDDAAFGQAKAIGLLAQDPCWRATARGEGVLVAAGLLVGEPAPEQIAIAVRWAVCDRYPLPQLVATWTEWHWEHIEQQEIDDADQFFRDFGDERDWRFWTTIEHFDRPRVPTPETAP